MQDVFVDAKVPRSERESWPLVVRGDEVVAIPGLVEVEGVKAERAVSQTEVEQGVGQVLIEEDDAPGPRSASSAARSPRTTPAATCC